MMRHTSAATDFAWVPVAKLLPDSVTSLRNAVHEAETATDLFTPGGCATVTTSGNVLVYTFNGCSGMGASALSGEVTATFTVSAGQNVQLVVSASNATDENEALSVAATAWVTFDSSGTRTVRWNGTETATLADASVVSLAFDLRITRTSPSASGCNTLNGTAEEATDAGAIVGNVTDLTRCGAGTCPSGGTLVLTENGSQGAVTVTYNGTSSPDAHPSVGGDFTTSLSCGAP